jgi:hypothetical protein
MGDKSMKSISKGHAREHSAKGQGFSCSWLAEVVRLTTFRRNWLRG